MNTIETQENKVSVPVDEPQSILDDSVVKELVHRRIPMTEVGSEEEGNSETLVGKVESAIRAIELVDHVGSQAINSLSDLLDGQIGGMGGLEHEDDLFQERKIDLEALQLLYGVLIYMDEPPTEAAKLAYIGYWHYCQQSGDRIFTHYPEGYRIDRLRRAIDGFDQGSWYRWLRWDQNSEEIGRSRWTGDYGDVCYNIIAALVDIGCGQLAPEEAVRQYQIDLPTDSDTIIGLWQGKNFCHPDTPPILGSDSPSYGDTTLSNGKALDDSLSDHGDISDRRYLQMSSLIEVATTIDSRSESSFKNVVRRMRRRGDLKWAEIEQGVDYRIYPPHLPDPPQANLIKCTGEEYEPDKARSESSPEVMTDGGSDTRESSESFECPINGCHLLFRDELALLGHVSDSRDSNHLGMALDDSLEPIQKCKKEEILREQYVRNEKTLKELEKEWNIPRGTIHYWMLQFDIGLRPHIAATVDRATFYTGKEGYEHVSSYIPSTGSIDRTRVHQLLACLNHDPQEVFDSEKEIHHRNTVPWDNRQENIELIDRGRHQSLHMEGDWIEEDGFKVLST